METAIALLGYHAVDFAASGNIPPRSGSGVWHLVPYQAFRTSGGWMLVGAPNDGAWRRLCAALGAQDLASDSRYSTAAGRVAHKTELVSSVQAILTEQTTADWLARLEGSRIACAPINDLGAALSSPQVAATEMIVEVKDKSVLPPHTRKLVGNPIKMSGTPASINHLGVELLKQKAGLNALHIPYKGTNPAQMAVMAGEVDFLFDTFGTALAPHRAGRFRILATCGEHRSPSAPDIPTMIESGYPEVIVSTVNLVAMPGNTSEATVKAITRVTQEVMKDAKVAATLREMAIEPITDADPQQSADFFTKEIARWAPIVKASGVKL